MRGTGYAITEIIWWLLVAALIGFVIGWLLRKWFLDRQEDVRLATLEADEADKRAYLQAEIDDWEEKANSLSSDLEQRTADLDRMKLQVDERDQKIAGFEAKVSTHLGQVTKLEQKVEDREATIASLRANMGKEDSQVAALRKDLDEANDTVGTLRKDTEGYKSTIDSLRVDLDAERRKQAKLAEELAAARTDGDADARIAALEAELNQVRSDRDATADKLANLETVHAECETKLAAAQETAASAPAAVAELPDKEAAVAKVAEIATRTRGDGPRVEDDLKLIHGVGPKLEQLLKSMDITSFRQVAHFTRDDIQYVTAALDAFPGRIERDDWMSSAAEEHLKKYGEPA